MVVTFKITHFACEEKEDNRGIGVFAEWLLLLILLTWRRMWCNISTCSAVVLPAKNGS